ncbi:MAG: nucleoside kinase [Oscillospiraceae bacterium]|nr:nucleoside kinase [Oscillospiraceae bacterium]
MALDVREINSRIKNDPTGFVGECEDAYEKSIVSAAKKIAERIDTSSVVLLSGPSGSGKTTTALKLERTLEKLGIGTRPVSLDDYFRTVDFETAPKTEDGKIDYESPECLDMPLLNRHIKEIIKGNEIMMPKFDFKNQRRSETVTPLHLKKNEVVIFEGIHALNDEISVAAGSHGIKLYISARSNFMLDGSVFYKGTWTRLTRRIVRDNLFRGANADFTLSIWDGIRRGEKMYISPFKDRADITINSTHEYEITVLKKHLKKAVLTVPEGIVRYEEVCRMMNNIDGFEDLPDDYVPKDSLLREFIGGGSFRY